MSFYQQRLRLLLWLWRLSAKPNATNPHGGFVAREARVARGERTKHRELPDDFREIL